MRRLLGNLGRAAIAGGVPALTLVQTSDIGVTDTVTAFGLFALMWLAGAYEIDIRHSIPGRSRVE